MRWIAIACCMFACPGPAAAREIFVDNLSGDDLNDGIYEKAQAPYTGPVRTIAKATRLARPGDRIVLAATNEPYRETIGLSTGNHHGTAAGQFVIDGRGAILDGSAPVPADAWEHYAQDTFRFRPQRMAYQQLFSNGVPASRKPADRGQAKPPELQPLEWCLHRGYIYFRTEKDKLPGDYPLSYCRLQTGVTLYHVHGVRIENLIVQGFQLDGINAHDAVKECVLDNVVLRGNGRSGLSVGGCSRIRANKSTIGDNGAAQLRTEGIAQAFLEGCDLIPDMAPAIVKTGGRVLVDGQEAQQ